MITENTKAILLLTSFFNSNELKEYKTLTINEYGYFACWLHQNGYKPVDLLGEDSFDGIWASWDEPMSHIKAKQIIDFSRLENTIAKLTYDRFKDLLNRGASLSLALDKWQSAGVWIMDRQHPHYPQAIKKQLKHQSPAILFGVGNSELLTKQAIGFVGSRDCDADDGQAASQYVEQINQLNYQVVSGGAKGIDTHAMLASLNNGNTAIGVLADSLYRASASTQWRQHLKENNLVLVSPFYPEGRFTPPNAMARNKYIYLLSNATVVVTSGVKGGTWEGAKENLKKDWVRLLVSAHKDPLQEANQALIDGSALGKAKTKARALSISPTVSTVQLSELLLKTNEASHLQSETESLLTEPLPLSKDSSITPEDIENQNSAQNDMFATTGEETENETIIEEQNQTISGDVTLYSRVMLQENGEQQESTVNTEPKLTVELQELAQQQESTTPLLDNFYQQLHSLIEQQPLEVIDKSMLDAHFPEFEMMGKQALDKWLKYLVDQGKLVKTHARIKQYTLPKKSKK